MNVNFPNLILNGVLICLSAQLLVLGVLNILSRKNRQILLGFFCLIMSTTMIYNMFWPYFKTSAIFSILLADQKTLFYFPLLFLYIQQIRDESKVKILRHLLFPLMFFLWYAITKHVFKDFYYNHIQLIMHVVTVFNTIFYFLYAILSIIVLRGLTKILKQKVFKKYSWFYGFIIISFGITNVYSILSFYIELGVFYSSLNKYLFTPLYLINSIVVILFVFTESKQLTRFLFERKILVDKLVVDESGVIEEKIDVLFNQNKIYKNPRLKIDQVSTEIGITNAQLSEFISVNYDLSIIEFINSYRVEELKKLLSSGESKQYSITGLAEKAGFNSKATLYRVFKKHEGITPKKYMKNVAQNDANNNC